MIRSNRDALPHHGWEPFVSDLLPCIMISMLEAKGRMTHFLLQVHADDFAHLNRLNQAQRQWGCPSQRPDKAWLVQGTANLLTMNMARKDSALLPVLQARFRVRFRLIVAVWMISVSSSGPVYSKHLAVVKCKAS